MDKDKIIKALTTRKATNACARCGNNNFILADEYSLINVQDSLEGMVFGGKNIPTAMTICSNCGAITHHAIGVLGLLEGNK